METNDPEVILKLQYNFIIIEIKLQIKKILRNGGTVDIKYIRAHRDITESRSYEQDDEIWGNEIADKLAKEGTRKPLTNSIEWESNSLFLPKFIEEKHLTTKNYIKWYDQNKPIQSMEKHKSQGKYAKEMHKYSENKFDRHNTTLFRLKATFNVLPTMMNLHIRYGAKHDEISLYYLLCSSEFETMEHALIKCESIEWESEENNKAITLMEKETNIKNKQLWFTKIMKNEKNEIIKNNNDTHDQDILMASLGILTESQIHETINLGVNKKIARKIAKQVVKIIHNDAKRRWKNRCKINNEIQSNIGINKIIEKIKNESKEKREEVT